MCLGEQRVRGGEILLEKETLTSEHRLFSPKRTYITNRHCCDYDGVNSFDQGFWLAEQKKTQGCDSLKGCTSSNQVQGIAVLYFFPIQNLFSTSLKSIFFVFFIEHAKSSSGARESVLTICNLEIDLPVAGYLPLTRIALLQAFIVTCRKEVLLHDAINGVSVMKKCLSFVVFWLPSFKSVLGWEIILAVKHAICKRTIPRYGCVFPWSLLCDVEPFWLDEHGTRVTWLAQIRTVSVPCFYFS